MTARTAWCAVCGTDMTFPHDHKPDNSGLDDGPWIKPPRKKAAPKPPDVVSATRKQAWETRRAKYGPHGHNGSYSR